jgi:hypothetical protein
VLGARCSAGQSHGPSPAEHRAPSTERSELRYDHVTFPAPAASGCEAGSGAGMLVWPGPDDELGHWHRHGLGTRAVPCRATRPRRRVQGDRALRLRRVSWLACADPRAHGGCGGWPSCWGCWPAPQSGGSCCTRTAGADLRACVKTVVSSTLARFARRRLKARSSCRRSRRRGDRSARVEGAPVSASGSAQCR